MKQVARLEVIDVARGIFLTWMITAHSITMTGIAPDSRWQYLRPPGWSTTCFIMLSGMSIALVFMAPGRDFKQVRRRLYTRAFEIGAIAYLSNLVFVSLQLAIGGAFSWHSLIEIATFQHPWSISSVLLPVVLVLLLSPWLIRLATHMPPWVLFTAMTLLNLAIGIAVTFTPEPVRSSLAFQVSFLSSNPLGFFPLIGFVGLGMWCFALGELMRRGIVLEKHWVVIMPVCFLLLVSCGIWREFRNGLPGPVIAMNQFLISLGLAFLIVRSRPAVYVKETLGLLGRSSLLVFILHRPIIQALVLVMSPQSDKVTAMLVILSVTCLACVAMCWFNERHPKLAYQMKRVGF